MRHRNASVTAGIGLAVFVSASVRTNAQTQWANALGGNWNLAANWNPQDVPNSLAESAELGMVGAYTVTLDMSPVIGGLTISNPDAILDFPGGRILSLDAGTHVNDGLMRLNTNDSSSDAVLNFTAAAVLDGAGEVRLIRPGNDSRVITSGGATLTNAGSHTIAGTGEIHALLINEGMINANVDSSVLDLLSNAKTNNNLITATNNGILDIEGITVTQGAGGRIVGDGGTVRFPGGTNAGVIGGSVESALGGVVEKGAGGTVTLTDVTADATFNVFGAGVVAVTGTGLTNDGTISLNTNGSSSNAILTFSETGTLDGSGEVVLVRAGNDSQVTTAAEVTLTHSATHRIVGTGEIHAAMINEGVINANVDSSVLDLLGNAKTNNNLMTATNNGILEIESITVTQGAGGRIIADGGTVRFPTGTNAGVTGGRIESVNGGLVEKGTGTVTLTGVTADATFDVFGAGTIAVTGTGLTNDGTISLNTNGSSSDAILTFSETGTLGGSGEVVLVRPSNDSQVATGGGVTMTNGIDHTIRGTGQISATLVNEGLISADSAGSTLELFTNAKTNNSLMQAVSGGILNIHSVVITQANDAAIVADGGTVRFPTGTNAGVTGGSIESVSGGVVEKAGGGTITLTNVTADATFDVFGAGTIAVTGTGLTNNGTISLNTNGSSSDAILTFSETGTLNGTGEVVLVRAGNDSQVTTAPAVTMTNGPLHTIRGTGQISAALVNEGLISADSAGSTLELFTNAKTNNSLMQAVSGGILSIHSVVINQANDAAIVADGSTVRFPTATNAGVIGGSIKSVNAGVVEKAGSGTVTLTDVSADATFNVFGAGTIAVIGTGLTNDGTISLNTNSSSSDAILTFSESGTLGGTGEVVLVRAGNDSQVTTAPAVTMTNGPLHTIRGLGQLNGTFINEGTIVPGLSPGIMVVNGSLSQAASGVMDFEVGGPTAGTQYDRVQVAGPVALDGTAIVTITENFEPAFTNAFELVTATAGVTGRFADVQLSGFNLPEALEARFVYLATAARLIVTLLGDVDGDFDVDLVDFNTFATCYSGGSTVPPDGCDLDWFEACDLDNDGDVDLTDFTTFATNYTG